MGLCQKRGGESMNDKVNFLKSRGWYQWYNPDYWCHEQFATNRRDPTNWGMSTNEAFAFETDEESRQKTLAGMDILFTAQQTLSNLGTRKYER